MTNDMNRHHSNLTELFLDAAKKNEVKGVGNRPSAKQKHGGCVAALNKTAFEPPLLDACFMLILASESMFLLFPSQEQIQSGSWETAKTRLCNQVGVTNGHGQHHCKLLSLVRRCCCIVLE